MSECLVCGHQNRVDAQVCNLCGEVLVKRAVTAREQQQLLLRHGEDQGAHGTTIDDALRRHVSTARRFVMTALVLVGLLSAMPFVIAYYFPDREQLSLGQQTLFWTCLGYGLLVHAFLVGKTAQSVGAGFWFCFLLALFPPLIPAAWARVGGGSMLRPYGWLLLDGLLIALAWFLLRPWPWALPFIVLLIGPLLISQLFGCVVGNLAQALGLNNMLAVSWICIAPLILFIMMAFDLGLQDLIIGWASAPSLDFSAILGDLAQFVSENAAPSQVQFFLLGWLGLTVVIWLKTIYDNLKCPLMD